MGFWTGVAVGVAAVYFLDPEHGAQRRAMAREKYEQIRPSISGRMETAQPTIRDIGGRVRSAASRVPGLHLIRGGRSDEAPSVDGRPAVLAALTGTQMDEFTRQFREGDRQAWDTLAASYGWTPEQADEVWRWFEQRPDPDQAAGAA